MKNENNELIKTQFDFGWKKWDSIPNYVEPTLEHQRGDVLDIGCATCQLYTFLKSSGWNNNYYGIDIQKFEDSQYPEGVNLMIGDPMDIEFPKVDTIILYNVLEHIDQPLEFLKKSIKTAKQNVLVNVPKRNEELWETSIVEFHQLDKTHKHCGFSKEEIYKLSELSGGQITDYKELGEIDGTIAATLWENRIPRFIVYTLNRIFPSKKYYQDIWCEIIKK